MYCQNCGKKLNEGGLFCSSCGAKAESQNNKINNINQNSMEISSNSQQYVNPNNNYVKKFKWWIPLLFFIGGFVMFLCNSIAGIIIRSQGEFILDYQITNYPIIMIFRWLAVISWLMVIPSLIIVVVKYNKKGN